MASASYLLSRRLVCDAGTFESGTVASLDTSIGDRIVANGWAEKEAGRPRKTTETATGTAAATDTAATTEG